MSFASILSGLTWSRIRLYLYIAAGVALIAFGTWVYGLYQENQKLKYQAKETAQNVQALNDSLGQVRGQLIQGALFIRDLNSKVQKQEHEYTALKASFSSFIDSVHVHGTGVSAITDSSITVSFQGQQSIAHYNGRTAYEIKTGTSTWNLDLGFDPIPASFRLFQRGDAWNYEIQSLVPGVTLRGGGELDEDTYRRLQKYAPSEPMKRFMLGLAIGQQGGPEIGYRADRWNISTHYNLLDRSKIILENVNLHVLWCF